MPYCRISVSQTLLTSVPYIVVNVHTSGIVEAFPSAEIPPVARQICGSDGERTHHARLHVVLKNSEVWATVPALHMQRTASWVMG